VTVNTQQSGNQTKIVTARDEVRLLPGFSVKPTGSYSFTARIDETLLGDFVNNPEYSSPSARLLDNTLTVGSIVGSADVSPTGGALYNIPIALPEGVGGMTPQLAVTYNSQGRNGTMGPGWSIAGLSAITRTGRTIYHDDVASAMNLTSDDRLLLDGQRLISTSSGTPGINATGYRTENESYATITKGGTTSAPYFTVTTKDGKTIEYGNTIDSRMNIYPTVLGEKVIGWSINKVTDKFNNYIKYTYHQDESRGEQYIQKIEYGYGTTTVCSVVFGYDLRGDPWKGSIKSKERIISQTVLLKYITINVGSQQVGRYVFNYSLIDGTSKLVEVIQENGKGEQLNSTFFTWKVPVADLNVATGSSAIYPQNSNLIPVDFDGDGITDILQAPQNGNNWVFYKSSFGGLQFSSLNFTTTQYVGGYITQHCGNVPIIPEREQELATLMNTVQAYAIGDFDGDGTHELAVMTFRYEIGDMECSYLTGQIPLFKPRVNFHVVTLYKYNNGVISQIAQKEFQANNSTAKLAKHGVDFNHNGKAELIIDNKLYELNNGNLTEIGTTMAYSNFENAKWGDFNGDGRMDFVSSNGKSVYMQNSDNHNFSLHATLSDVVLAAVDINNDGISELLMRSNAPDMGFEYIHDPNGDYVRNDWNDFIYCPPSAYGNPNINPYYPHDPPPHQRFRRENYNRGYMMYLADHTGQVIEQLGYFPNNNQPVGAFVADIDADGTPDLLIYRQNNSNLIVEQILYQFRTKNAGAGYGYTWQTVNRSINMGAAMQGDFDGDGIEELLTPAGVIWKFASGSPGQLLASATNGYNQRSLFEYAPLTATGMYIKGGASAYPIATLAEPLYVAKSIKQDNGSAAQTVVNYAYSGGKVHLHGKGFLGFTGITATNTTLGAVTATANTFDLTRGVLSKSVTTTTIDNKAATRSNTFTITQHGSYPKVFYMHLSERKETDIDNNVVTTTYTVTPTNGNTTQEHADYGGVQYITVNYSGHTAMGYPQTVQTIQKHPNDPIFTTTNTYQYNANGRMTKKVENATSSMPLTIDYGYDAFGNLISTKLSAPSIKTITYLQEYDNTKRFVSKLHTSPASTVSTFAYDVWGNVTLERDETNPSNPLETIHAYNGWGVRTVTTLPNGQKINYQTGWNSPITADKSYFTYIHGNDIQWVKTWYDAAGRQTETETIGAKDISMKTINTYNTKGQLYQIQNIRGNLTITETHTYDALGRIATHHSTSTNQTATYSYGNRSQTASVNSRTYTKTFDAWGNILSSSDPLTSVAYQYHSSGQPKSITAAGATFGMTYNDRGKQATLTDPNAGTISYTYDALGRLKTQTDGKGALTTMHYNRTGRDSLMVQGGVNTTYVYGTSGNEKERLINMQTGNNSVSFTYNRYGQPVTEQRVIDGSVQLDFMYQYNSKSQLQKTTYPNNVAVSNVYDAYGNLVEVKAGEQTVWKLAGNTGMLTTTELGGVMTAKQSYNSQGYLTNLNTVKGSATIRNMNFVFNGATGNLTSRTGMYYNGSIAQTETFAYDNLDRLTSATGGSNAMAITYALNGNITSKTGLGAYAYGANGAGPHAVTSVATYPGAVLQQNVTYNAFNMPQTISHGNYLLNITYGPDRQRWKTELKLNNAVTKTMIFAGNYERITEGGVTKELIYMPGGAIYAKQAGQTDKIYYAHKDHLGSIIKITDDAGTAVFAASYDAWGNRTVTNNSFPFHRGYAGHEHLDELGLINANARLYDPMLGCFLSPDPIVQNPFFSQSYNRYTYAGNNPLFFKDPFGMNIQKYDDDIWDLGVISEVVITGTRGGGSGWFPIYVIDWGYNDYFDPFYMGDYDRGGSGGGDGGSRDGSTNWGYGGGGNSASKKEDILNDINSGVTLGTTLVNIAAKTSMMPGDAAFQILGGITKWTGRFGGIANITISGIQFSQALTLDKKIEYGFDIFMGVMSFTPLIGPPISIYWGTVGKPLHYQWVDRVLIPQHNMGIIGLPSTMPFK